MIPHKASDFVPVQQLAPVEPGWDANGAPTTEEPDTHVEKAVEPAPVG